MRHRELYDGGPSKALISFRAYASLLMGELESELRRAHRRIASARCACSLLGYLGRTGWVVRWMRGGTFLSRLARASVC
jgi:hypothetical protein